MNGDVLARNLLAELPSQVMQYMSMIAKPPGQIVPQNIEHLIKKIKSYSLYNETVLNL